MDFSKHPLNPNRLSIIDLKENKQSIIDISTIDYYTAKLSSDFNDTTLGSGLVAKALKYLGEAQVNNIADYVTRKAHNPGRAFVKICVNEIAKKSVV